MFRWMSMFTGELQENIFFVIGEVIETIKAEDDWPLKWKLRYAFQWKYSRSGF